MEDAIRESVIQFSTNLSVNGDYANSGEVVNLKERNIAARSGQPVGSPHLGGRFPPTSPNYLHDENTPSHRAIGSRIAQAQGCCEAADRSRRIGGDHLRLHAMRQKGVPPSDS